MENVVDNRFDKMINLIRKIGIIIGSMTSYLVLAIIGITVFEVIMRYCFNNPTVWVHETSEMLFAVMFLIGGSYTVIYDGHVRVDIFYNRLSNKKKMGAEILTLIFFMLYLSVLTYQGTIMAIESCRQFERSQTPFGPYIFPVITLVPIASFLMLLQGIVRFIVVKKELERDRKL
jgi:TRAP-type mannitol/chloroaromatic compound transport system permease small subunit